MSNVRLARLAFSAIALFGLLSIPCLAQTEDAVISGRVTDQTGAVVAAVSVQLASAERGTTQEATTNGSGIYVFAAVHPGVYHITVRKEGFHQVDYVNLTANVQDHIEQNFKLQVGSITESVTVTADAMNINTTDAAVSTVVDQSYVKNMPLNGRSFQDLILLTPGVVTDSPQNEANAGNIAGGQGEFSVNGQRTESNYYTVDGVSANLGVNPTFFTFPVSGITGTTTAQGTTQALVSVDDLQEFRVQSSTYSAEYGRSPGGQFAFETKSGTNQWHGSAYDYLRNGVFDAQDWFNDYFGTRFPALRQNDFGGTLGGPVRIPGVYNGKDKTFFFVSYEGLRLVSPQPATNLIVPNLCVRGQGPCLNGDTPADPAVQPAFQAFPLPNGTDFHDGSALYHASWSNPSAIDSTSVRIDHVVKDRLRLFFRFSDTPSYADNRGNGFAASTNVVASGAVRTYTAGATALLSSRLSNDFRLNYSSNETSQNDTISPIGGSSPIDLQKLSNVGPNSNAEFAACLGNSSECSVLFQGPTLATQRQWNLVDNVSLSLGRHQFKFGGDYRRLTPFAAPIGNPYIVTFFDSFTFQYQTNQPYTSVEAISAAYPLYRNFSLYATDDWKVTQRLTLNMGLRWELNPPPGATRGLMPYTYQGTSLANYSAAPQGTPLWKTAWLNFAPRLGLAYTLRDKQGWETVVRTGGGVYFDTGQQLGSEGFIKAGFSAVNTFCDPSFGCSNPTAPFPIDATAAGVNPTIVNPPGSDGNPYSLIGFHPHLQLPYTIDWNTSVEQALGTSQAFTVSYVGSHAARLLQHDSFQLPNSNPNLNGFDLIQNGLTSDYHALQLQFQRRLSAGLTALGSYTWSHSLDYGSYNYYETKVRGNSTFDVRHNFSAAFSYNVPNVGHDRFTSAVLQHWGVDDRLAIRTGFPVGLMGTGLHRPDGQSYDAGVDYTGEPVYLYGANCQAVYSQYQTQLSGQPVNAGPCPGGRAINPCAFISVGDTRGPSDPCTLIGMGNQAQGLAPRNVLRGFGAWQMNLAIRREFPIYENLKLQFRAEAFNVFNHPNFGFIDSYAGSPTFGLATQTLAQSLAVMSSQYQMGGNRSMQFALKVIF